MKNHEETIFSDSREKQGAFPSFQRKLLEVGDFFFGKDICVEHKAEGDFESSLLGGNIRDHVIQMNANFNKSVIAVTGNPDYGKYEHACLAHIASIIVRTNTSIVFLKNTSQLEYFVKKLQEKSKDGKKYESVKRIKSSLEPQDVLRLIKGIGPKVAKKALLEFKTVSKLDKCKLEDLAKIVGLRTAVKIKNGLKTLLHSEYIEKLKNT